MRGLHQVGCLAEIGLVAGGIDQGADFAAPDDRTGEDGVAGFLAGGQRLPGQGGLIHGDLVAIQETGIGGNDVAQTQTDHVPRHELLGRRRAPCSVASDPGGDGKLGLQRLDSIARLTLLPETDHGIGEQ